MKALSIAATGMLAQQTNVEVISNNIANMNTTAYKRQRAEFHDLLYQNLERVGANSSDTGTIVPSGIQIGTGVRTAAVNRMMTQGNMDLTDGKLDLAINGRGFFRVLLPDGTDGYTRAGSFQLSADGELVTLQGFIVQPSITVPEDATDITISRGGELQVTLDGQIEPSTQGIFELTIFPNDAGLQALGDSMYRETAASGAPSTGAPGDPGIGQILQGYLETSNVNSVTEITKLITAQRAYDMNSKVIGAADEMLSTATNIR